MRPFEKCMNMATIPQAVCMVYPPPIFKIINKIYQMDLDVLKKSKRTDKIIKISL